MCRRSNGPRVIFDSSLCRAYPRGMATPLTRLWCSRTSPTLRAKISTPRNGSPVFLHAASYLLQQRFIASLTRVVVPLDNLRQACEHVLEEADLLEEWVEELGTSDDSAEAVKAFTEFMDDGLRDDLTDPTRRSQVRKTVTREISERRSDD